MRKATVGKYVFINILFFWTASFEKNKENIEMIKINIYNIEEIK